MREGVEEAAPAILFNPKVRNQNSVDSYRWSESRLDSGRPPKGGSGNDCHTGVWLVRDTGSWPFIRSLMFVDSILQRGKRCRATQGCVRTSGTM